MCKSKFRVRELVIGLSLPVLFWLLVHITKCSAPKKLLMKTRHYCREWRESTDGFELAGVLHHGEWSLLRGGGLCLSASHCLVHFFIAFGLLPAEKMEGK